MRQIKFSAWEAEYSQMVSWEELKDPCSSGVYLDYLEPDPSGDPVIMQYIGLKDKNGCEIYESDIVMSELVRDWDLVNPDSIEFKPYVIEWSERGCWTFSGKTQWYDGTHEWLSIENVGRLDIEVIGNIYETPELLPK